MCWENWVLIELVFVCWALLDPLSCTVLICIFALALVLFVCWETNDVPDFFDREVAVWGVSSTVPILVWSMDIVLLSDLLIYLFCMASISSAFWGLNVWNASLTSSASQTQKTTLQDYLQTVFVIYCLPISLFANRKTIWFHLVNPKLKEMSNHQLAL